MSGLWALAIAMLMEPTAGDWRLITDDPGNAVLAVEVSGVTGPPTRRVVTTVAVNRASLEGERYLFTQVAIDCHQHQSTLVSADVKALNGAVLESLDPDALESKTAPTSDGSPTAVALACEGAPVNSRRFGSDVAFITWAADQLSAP